jgi:hypothetical protein
VYHLDDGPDRYIVAVDASGDVVWYVTCEYIARSVRQLPNGNLLMVTGRSAIAEMDLLGTVVHEWRASNVSEPSPDTVSVAADSFHHDVVPLEGGTYLTLSTEIRAYCGYPMGKNDPTPRINQIDVVGDVVMEFASDGTIVAETRMLDVLDPYRARFNPEDVGHWDDFYSVSPTVDWGHSNAVIPSCDGGFIISIRHQDAVVKVDAAGELVWILGPHTGWKHEFTRYLLTPIGEDFLWQSRQHAPQITGTGTLLMFDNHNKGTFLPGDGGRRRSRAVEYRIDEERMTVEQVWQYDPGDLYAGFVGDADELPVTGNVLVTFGGLRDEPEGLPSARILEVTRETPSSIVWELAVEADDPSGRGNYHIYGSQRIRTLAL